MKIKVGLTLLLLLAAGSYIAFSSSKPKYQDNLNMSYLTLLSYTHGTPLKLPNGNICQIQSGGFAFTLGSDGRPDGLLIDGLPPAKLIKASNTLKVADTSLQMDHHTWTTATENSPHNTMSVKHTSLSTYNLHRHHSEDIYTYGTNGFLKEYEGWTVEHDMANSKFELANNRDDSRITSTYVLDKHNNITSQTSLFFSSKNPDSAGITKKELSYVYCKSKIANR